MLPSCPVWLARFIEHAMRSFGGPYLLARLALFCVPIVGFIELAQWLLCLARFTRAQRATRIAFRHAIAPYQRGVFRDAEIDVSASRYFITNRYHSEAFF